MDGHKKHRAVFQGAGQDIHESGLKNEPFSQSLVVKQDTARYRLYNKPGVPVFADGLVMIFQQD